MIRKPEQALYRNQQYGSSDSPAVMSGMPPSVPQADWMPAHSHRVNDGTAVSYLVALSPVRCQNVDDGSTECRRQKPPDLGIIARRRPTFLIHQGGHTGPRMALPRLMTWGRRSPAWTHDTGVPAHGGELGDHVTFVHRMPSPLMSVCVVTRSGWVVPWVMIGPSGTMLTDVDTSASVPHHRLRAGCR